MRLWSIKRKRSDSRIKRAARLELAGAIDGGGRSRGGERGFTLIETMISIVIMVISILGMASLFTYAVTYNSGADARQQALAVAQKRMERLRDVAFTDASLNATNGTSEVVTSAGRQFKVTTTITNTPAAGTAVLKTVAVEVSSIKRDKQGETSEVKEVSLRTQRTAPGLGAN
ncbi:MAG TPA: prepilin-type N-terminal cleavage/methylation domain-containing protein [Blastocatellia bacterium]|jgi:type IV pilus modification protein PilV|nr:prepilin-type N-terminal cleavage/methylation domain-containing protein [Blastocatellia bacterium]